MCTCKWVGQHSRKPRQRMETSIILNRRTLARSHWAGLYRTEQCNRSLLSLSLRGQSSTRSGCQCLNGCDAMLLRMLSLSRSLQSRSRASNVAGLACYLSVASSALWAFLPAAKWACHFTSMLELSAGELFLVFRPWGFRPHCLS